MRGLDGTSAFDGAEDRLRVVIPARSFSFKTAFHVISIAVVGILYRATFITQGFNATDEGWLQSVGRRIVMGEVPYRDFRFAFHPVSIYKEAAFESLFGDAYTILFSRWVFVGEATMGSVIAYLILRRFVSPGLALLTTLPTIFFSVLMYYFANYTYDAEVLLLAAFLLLTMSDLRRTWPAFAAGVAASLATLAKPNYAAVIMLVVGVGVLCHGVGWIRKNTAGTVFGAFTYWPRFLAGSLVTFGAVLGMFAVAGAARQFLQQAFLEDLGSGTQRGIGFAIWQDLPTAFTSREWKLFGAVFALLIVSALISATPSLRRFAWMATLLIPVGLVLFALKYFHGASGFLPMAMGLLLVMNLAGLLVALAVRVPQLHASAGVGDLRRRLPPPMLFAAALVMQYLAQFTFTGIIYSYLGAYLSLPLAVLLLYSLSDQRRPGSPGTIPATMAAGAPVLFGVWIVLASANFVHNYVYFDAPRAELNATFQTPKLAGITSTPANVRRIDGVVRLVDEYSKPGDPVLVIQDFSALYFLTDRANPTSQDWYLTAGNQFVPQSEIGIVLTELKHDPPKVVVIQSVSEFDWARSYRPDYVINYTTGRLAPLYEYLTAHYVVVSTVDDIKVLIPSDGP